MYSKQDLRKALLNFFPNNDFSGDGPWVVGDRAEGVFHDDGDVLRLDPFPGEGADTESVVVKSDDPVEDVDNLLKDNIEKVERILTKVIRKMN